MENKTPTKEEIEEQVKKLPSEFAERYVERIKAKREAREPLDDAENYVLDLCAESLDLPISKMDEVTLSQLRDFITNYRHLEVAIVFNFARELYVAQFLVPILKLLEDEFGKTGMINFHEWDLAGKTQLLEIKEQYKMAKDDIVSLIDLAVALFNCRSSHSWKPGEVKLGSTTLPFIGRKNTREQAEKAENSDES